MTLVFGMVELLGVRVNSIDSHDVSKHVDRATREDLVTSKVVISDESLARLLNLAGVGKLLSAKEACKRIITVVLVVSLTDLNSIISQVVVDYKRSVFRSAVET